MYGTIRVELSSERKAKPSVDTGLAFGKYFTDHMFMMNYSEGSGWHDPRIVPYAPITLDPSAMVFHYGQAIFEGLKAYRSPDKSSVYLFRPDKNAARLNQSCERLSMPSIDEAFFVEALQSLVRIDADWIPESEGTSLYIRPFIISTEAGLGVRPSSEYLFAVIMSPVGSYYEEGIHPVAIHVETHYTRAAVGGMGYAKAAGNYAGSLKAQMLAKEYNCSQVLWLDAAEKKYLEEVGSMNVFFKLGGEIVTPKLNGSILDGVTRNSVMQLLASWGMPVTERRISMDEIAAAFANGTLEEAFGTGTAAVISPIGSLHWNDQTMSINVGQTGPLTERLYNTLTGIQNGKIEDPFGWNVRC
ncbi:branched-chain amino acid aminotransferase [Paenibacillus hexagrammi]|uniref:Branched-chain-amino-acid aminotransferase n=1 Tax=Paenibacillus hexagrammi TaxID=2908839 RepID=A0ABY3SIZ2_9BACL|nr:branched-chain amino acid aminotransferase [Paenibacillus sp. YPD9-1]UJF32952.1 branched-chain amino acid aminotransferase [Paenibacillus sp. YPD9-1]